MIEGLAVKISSLRKENGHTQEYLADYLNVSRSSIGNYEQGLNEPALDVLVKICDLYQVSLDWILGRTEIRYNFNLDRKENIEVIIKIYEVLKDYDIKRKHE